MSAPLAKFVTSIWPVQQAYNVRRLDTGLVNETYILSTSQGDLVLQQLGDVFSKEEVVMDQVIIAQHLVAAGVPAIGPLLTRNGNFSAKIEGRISKLSYFVKNDGSMKGKAGTTLLKNAGRMLGRMHATLARVNYVPKFFIPNFHDQEHYVARLLAASNSASVEKYERVQSMIILLQREIELYMDSLGSTLDRQLIHGDPKIDNFLFRDDEVCGVIDLDTFMVGSVFIDIGDAFRSWLRRPDGTFDHETFPRVLDAYTAEYPLLETTDKQVLRATKLIALELAARFLTDYFEESYFNWDRSKYASSAEHNLARTQEMLAYAETII